MCSWRVDIKYLSQASVQIKHLGAGQNEQYCKSRPHTQTLDIVNYINLEETLHTKKIRYHK